MSYARASAVLEMTTPLVGWLPGTERMRLARSPRGELIVPPGWWPPLLDFGASALSRYQRLVRGVKFSAVVRADVGVYRWQKPDGEVAEAECIDRLVVVEMVRPTELEPHGLKEAMDMGGQYVGIMPQKWAAGFGRFKVIDLT
jgi:hypothetical protein